MKRRLLLTLFALLLLFSACAGEDQEPPEQSEISIYRVLRADIRSGSELVRAQELALDDVSNAVSEAAAAFSLPPEDQELESALPEGVEILKAELSGRTVDVLMNDKYLELEGMEKSLLDGCIALTMCSIPNIDYVAIHTKGEPPESRLSSDDIFFRNNATRETQAYIRLYFPRVGTNLLSCEYRLVSVGDDTSAERVVLEELLRGPESDKLFSVLPENAVLISVDTNNGLCNLSLSEEFLEILEMDADSVRLAVYSIVNSLTCLKKVDSVKIIIQNSTESALGSIDISEPLVRKAAMIGAAVID